MVDFSVKRALGATLLVSNSPAHSLADGYRLLGRDHAAKTHGTPPLSGGFDREIAHLLTQIRQNELKCVKGHAAVARHYRGAPCNRQCSCSDRFHGREHILRRPNKALTFGPAHCSKLKALRSHLRSRGHRSPPSMAAALPRSKIVLVCGLNIGGGTFQVNGR